MRKITEESRKWSTVEKSSRKHASPKQPNSWIGLKLGRNAEEASKN
jgi:hypothetical protein